MTDRIQRVMWRVPSGYTHKEGQTLQDIIDHNQDLGNNIEWCYTDDIHPSEINANYCGWYCINKTDAKRYTNSEDTESTPVPTFIQGFIIGMDNEGGFLIYAPTSRIQL